MSLYCYRYTAFVVADRLVVVMCILLLSGQGDEGAQSRDARARNTSWVDTSAVDSLELTGSCKALKED